MVQASMSSFSEYLGTADGFGIVVLAGLALILFWEALIIVCVLLATLSDRRSARTHVARRS